MGRHRRISLAPKSPPLSVRRNIGARVTRGRGYGAGRRLQYGRQIIFYGTRFSIASHASEFVKFLPCSTAFSLSSSSSGSLSSRPPPLPLSIILKPWQKARSSKRAADGSRARCIQQRITQNEKAVSADVAECQSRARQIIIETQAIVKFRWCSAARRAQRHRRRQSARLSERECSSTFLFFTRFSTHVPMILGD